MIYCPICNKISHSENCEPCFEKVMRYINPKHALNTPDTKKLHEHYNELLENHFPTMIGLAVIAVGFTCLIWRCIL